jgi:hypothetical protein
MLIEVNFVGVNAMLMPCHNRHWRGSTLHARHAQSNFASVNVCFQPSITVTQSKNHCFAAISIVEPRAFIPEFQHLEPIISKISLVCRDQCLEVKRGVAGMKEGPKRESLHGYL